MRSRNPVWRSRDPFLTCFLSNPRNDFRAASQVYVKGLIDTGANVVLVPIHIARSLDLTQVDRTVIETAGSVHSGIVYDARILIQELNVVFDDIRVCAIKGGNASVGVNSDGAATVLLGRSLLKRFHLEFDGPAEEFSISLP